MRHTVLRVLAMSALMLMTGVSFAHKVSVFAWTEGDTVHVETKFAGGSVAKDSEIAVLGEQGQKFLSGRTDADGRWVFKLPSDIEPQTLTLRLDAGEGHQAMWKLAPKDFPSSALLASKASVSSGRAPDLVPHGAKRGDTELLEQKTGYAQSEEVEKRVVEAVRAERERIEHEMISPLRRELALAQNKGPGPMEVLGGIGWIFGIFSTLGYWRLRRRLSRK